MRLHRLGRVLTIFTFTSLLLAIGGCSGKGGGSTPECEGLPDGAPCGAGGALICLAGTCVTPGCGDGVVSVGEVCDDGNQVAGDGCEPTCTHACEQASDCDDAVACNGVETCSTATSTCVAGTPTVCPASDLCHVGVCEPSTGGCVDQLIDGDGDQHAAESLGACGSDCNDNDLEINPDYTEICGDGKDNNCSGDESDAATFTFYADCDRDGYAPMGAASGIDCRPPATTAATTGCPDDGGVWVLRAPVTQSTRDCADSEPSAHPDPDGDIDFQMNAIPGSASWDWNCDGSEELEVLFADGDGCRLNPACAPSTCCESGRGTWAVGVDPACGVTATFEFCGDDLSNAGFCPDDAQRQQNCR